jgi:hypothetical protein
MSVHHPLLFDAHIIYRRATMAAAMAAKLKPTVEALPGVMG